MKIFLLAAFVALAGCQLPLKSSVPLLASPPPTLTNTITAYATLRPRYTSTPIPSITPTRQPSPTMAIPDQVGNGIGNFTVVRHETFESLEHIDWNFYDPEAVSLIDGALQITGKPFWGGGAEYNFQFPEGTGIIFRFKYTGLGDYLVSLSSGLWDTSTFRSFGFINSIYPNSMVYYGQSLLPREPLNGNFQPVPGNWYMLAMSIQPGGKLSLWIYDPVFENRVITYSEDFDENWSGLTWSFTAKATDGTTLLLDDFMQITLDD